MSFFNSTDTALPIIEPIDSSVDQMALQVDDPRRILAVVRDLAMQAEPVTVYTADGQASLPGRLVQVTEPGRRIVVQAEGATPPAAGPALLVAAPGNLRLQFQAQFDWRQRAAERLEGTADLPSAVVQLQRRRFVRQETPLGPSLRAVFQAKGKRRVLSVDDLSLGGVGLRGPLREHRDLATGLRLERVRLELGAALLMDLRLDICSRRPYKSFLAGEQLHFGCEFVDLGDEAQAALHKILERLGKGGGAVFQDTAL